MQALDADRLLRAEERSAELIACACACACACIQLNQLSEERTPTRYEVLPMSGSWNDSRVLFSIISREMPLYLVAG